MSLTAQEGSTVTKNPAADSEYGDTKEAVLPVTNRQKLALGLTALGFMAIGMLLGGRIFGGTAPPAPAPAPAPQNVPDSWHVDGQHNVVNLEQRLSSVCDAAFQASGVTTAETGVVQGAAPKAGPNDWCTVHDGANFATPLSDQIGSFVMTADFGRNGFCCQIDVAKEMALAAAQMTNGGCASATSGVNFVINGGDAFYEIGLQTTQDAHVDNSWREIYLIYPELNKPWYGVLGNHDYMGSVNAQVELTKEDALRVGSLTNGRWKLGDPDLTDVSKPTVIRGDTPPRDAARRYFFHEETFCDGEIGLFIFLDSSPYLPQYYHDIDQGWGVARDGYYGAEDGVRAVNDQDRQDQIDWLISLLQRRGEINQSIPHCSVPGHCSVPVRVCSSGNHQHQKMCLVLGRCAGH